MPIGFGDNAFVPTASVGLWSCLFAGLEIGVSVALGGTGNAADGSIDVLDLEWRDEADVTSPVFARRGISDTSDGTGATMSDGAAAGPRRDALSVQNWDLEFEWRLENWAAETQLSATPTANGIGWYNQLGDPANADTSVELGNMGDGRTYQSAQSFHLGTDIWLVPNGVALRLGGSMEFSPTTQPDAILYPGPRYGVGAGFSFADRGYSVDVGYLHLFTQAIEIANGHSPVRNVAQIAAESEPRRRDGSEQRHLHHQRWVLGMGVRADVATFAKQPPSAAKGLVSGLV